MGLFVVVIEQLNLELEFSGVHYIKGSCSEVGKDYWAEVELP